jgi:hypothetical protein
MSQDASTGDHSRSQRVSEELPIETIDTNCDRVTDLQPEDTEVAPFYYTFKVQCTSCREIHPNPVSVSRFVGISSNQNVVFLSLTDHQDQNEQSGSRGEANFVWRCKNCKVRSCNVHIGALQCSNLS